jgi:outer membrane protein OmpA-like peptidoglycan-associated protein
MKKFLMVLALASVSVAGMAQETTEKYSVATNSFWSNWFVQANVAGTAFYSSQERNAGFSKSPLKDFRNNLGLSLAIGKWFTPGLGLRTKVNGVWGRTVSSEDAKTNASKYWQANEQVLFNLSNMLCGYNPNRVWNFIPFGGADFTRNWTDNRSSIGLSAGLLNEFNISRKFAINLELGAKYNEADKDGVDKVLADPYRKGWKAHDVTLYAEIGFTYNLGRATWDAVPDVDAIKAMYQAQIDALNSQLNDANAEIARLNDIIKNHKCPTNPSLKEFVNTPVSVFFNLNRTEIASQKDLVNVRALAKYAVDNKTGVLVTGYADSATGNAEHNQWLSEQRAETVAGELEDMGVDRSKIRTVGQGGVDTLSPIEFNRRATVQITE